jgi:hypothetical protein
MLQRLSTTLVALTLVASAGQAAPVTGDQGATSTNQAVAGNQDAAAVNHGRFALTVIGDKGTTLVNRGTGFSPVTGTTELKPGDRILVRNGAGARITYPDGCNVPVGGVATVDPLSPCNFMAADLPAHTAPPPYVEPVVEAEAFPYWPLAFTALAFGGTAACVALCGHHGENNFPFIPPIVALSPGGLTNSP